MSFSSFVSDAASFFSGLPNGTYSGAVATALAVERLFAAYAKKDWHPSLRALRTSLAAFIAPSTTPITVTTEPTASTMAILPAATTGITILSGRGPEAK